MRKIQCIIVEDEPASQDILQRYIGEFPALELSGVCSNAREAAAVLNKKDVDLIFLDIKMPGLSGIDFYRSLTDPPYVIFTTAFPQYAVNGFELDAVDYLVKPFPFDRFVKAVNKCQDLIRTNVAVSSGFVLLHADKKMHKVGHDNILVIEAMGDYIKVKTNERSLIVHQTLQNISEILPRDLFLRIHKSYIISLKHLKYIEGNIAVVDGEKIPIGNTYRNEFLTILQRR